jgi:protein O-mannosyl-transferase
MPVSSSASKLHVRRWALVALLAGAAVYTPAIGNGFAFDDDVVIVRNRLLRSSRDLPALVSRTEWAGSGLAVAAYRPLTGATYALNHAISGHHPWSYHLANALLHGLASGLCVLLAAELGLPAVAAGLAGLLFALHPLHVEAVANVVGRKDVLATVLVLAMVLAHRAGQRRNGALLALAPLAYAGAMLAKEVGAVGIALVALLDVLAPSPTGAPEPAAAARRRRRAALYAGHLVALGAYAVLLRAVTAGVADAIPFEDNPAASAPAGVRLLTAVAVIGKGLLLHVAPVGLSPDYSFDAIPLATGLFDPRVLATTAALAAWGIAGAFAWRRGAPLGLAALGWYLLALLPASNLLFPIGTIFGERLLYLPSVATALLGGAALAAAARHLPAAAVRLGGATLAALLALATVRCAAAWESDRTLFERAAYVVPRSSKVQHKLAVLRLAAGDAPGALEAADRAAALRPGNAGIEVVRAEIFRALDRRDDEAAALARALAANPDEPDAIYAAGRRAQEAGRLDEAEGHWRRVIALRPRHAGALADLSTLAFVRGDAAGALSLALRAVDANERQASAWYNLGLVHRGRGDAPRARDAFARFVATAGPEYAAAAAEVRTMLARGEPR